MPKAKHIVIADGCGLTRGLISLVLGAEGVHKVTETAHDYEVLSVLRAYKVHLLILAQEINGVAGVDLVRQVRSGQCGCRPNIPIVVLGGPSGTDDRRGCLLEKAMAAGATAYVSKPFSIRKLHPVIFRALHHKDQFGLPEFDLTNSPVGEGGSFVLEKQ